MKSISNILISHAIFIAIFAFAAYALAQEEVDCTADAKQCPDGSYVGRSGPNCEFKTCPTETTDPNMDARQVAQQEALQKRQETLEAKKEALAEAREENGTSTEFRQTQIEEKRQKIQNTITDRRAQLDERAQERITKLSAGISYRMEAVITRFSNIISRIESRIIKSNALGIDTTKANNALASAKLSVEAATEEISNIDIIVYEAITSEDATTGWNTAKTKYASTRNHLLTAHNELRTCVSALKEAIATNENIGVSEALRNDQSEASS